MTFQSAFVHQKLTSLEGYTKELQILLEKTLDEEFLSNSGAFHVAERLVQLIVDGMIDINQHFIRELNLKISDDLQGTFQIMGEYEVLPLEFSRKIAPVTGVRNILVHQYEQLDKKMFLRNLRNHFSDFSIYQKHIIKYLERNKN